MTDIGLSCHTFPGKCYQARITCANSVVAKGEARRDNRRGRPAPDSQITMSSTASTTSLSLLDRVRDPANGDAWARLTRVYTGLLKAWFAAAGLQPADRDDLTQEALAIVLRRVRDFEHRGRPGAFRAWLRGIASNLLREHWRARPAAQADSVLVELADPGSELSRSWDADHEQHVLAGLFDVIQSEFTVSTWQAFRRTGFEGEPARQVAEELGLSVNAVLIAKSRVLARLRELAAGLLD
jgi:RNA polymerase sigma factor (sigma-70 family)